MAFERLKNLLTPARETTNNARLTSYGALPEMSEETEPMATPQPVDLYARVLRVLAQHKALPFLALVSLVDSDDEELEGVIERMQREGEVKVVNLDARSDKIITLRHKGFKAAAGHG